MVGSSAARRGPVAVILLLVVLSGTAVRLAAARLQLGGHRAFWTGQYATALSRYRWLELVDPLNLEGMDGQLQLFLGAMDSSAQVASELNMGFSEAAGRGSAVLKHLVERAPLRPETWGGVADFFGAVKLENQRHRVYALGNISPRPEENLEPEDLLQIRALELASAVDPNGYYYWDTLGDLCWNLGLHSLALQDYREAVTLQPDQSQHLFLSATDLAPELEETAVRAMGQAVLPPRNADPESVHRSLGYFLMSRGRFGEAQEAFRKAGVESLSGDYSALQAYAAAHEGHDDEAIRLFRKALAWNGLEPEEAFQIHMNLGDLFEKGGNQEEAAREFHAALSIRPRDPQALLTLGRIVERLGRLEEAEDLYVKAADTSAGRITSLVNLVEFYRRIGRPAEALGPAQKLVELEPDEAIYRKLVQQLSQEIDGRRVH
jgi:tetratricopeptide (TPR) repeat protein